MLGGRRLMARKVDAVAGGAVGRAAGRQGGDNNIRVAGIGLGVSLQYAVHGSGSDKRMAAGAAVMELVVSSRRDAVDGAGGVAVAADAGGRDSGRMITLMAGYRMTLGRTIRILTVGLVVVMDTAERGRIDVDIGYIVTERTGVYQGIEWRSGNRRTLCQSGIAVNAIGDKAYTVGCGIIGSAGVAEITVVIVDERHDRLGSSPVAITTVAGPTEL